MSIKESLQQSQDNWSRRQMLTRGGLVVGGVIAVSAGVYLATRNQSNELNADDLYGPIFKTDVVPLQYGKEAYQLNIAFRTRDNASVNHEAIANLCDIYRVMGGKLPEQSWIDFVGGDLYGATPGARAVTMKKDDKIFLSLGRNANPAAFFDPGESLNGALASQLAVLMFKNGTLLPELSNSDNLEENITDASASLGVMVSYIYAGYSYEEYAASINKEVKYGDGKEFMFFDSTAYNRFKNDLSTRLVNWNWN